MNRIVYGADTETCHGKPMSLQFYSEHIACDRIEFVNEKTALDVFLKFCGSLKTDCMHVIYVHHLEFDLIEFLWKHHAKLIGESGSGDFEFKVGKWHISGVYGGPTFCKMSDGHHRQVWLIDTFSWFKESLAKAGERVCPNLPKLKRIEGIGEKLFTKRDAGFVDYAMRDAVIAYHLGCAIDSYHQRYDIAQSVSVADMAAKIFRRRFLNYSIPLPRQEIIDASFASYHGGKNNITVPAGWYEGVSSLDLSSAFPKAMHMQPAYSNEKLYRAFKAKAGTKAFPPHGVYCVSGTAKKTKFPVIFTDNFKPLTDCDVTRQWVQGWELNEAIASGDFKVGKVRGYYYDAEKDHQAPALRGYVDEFYALKNTEKNKVLRKMHKDTLVSLYGKFIQTRKHGASEFTDIDSGVTTTASDLIAGGLFHPFIASEITAITRARIRRLEERWDAMHTATDGIFTQHAVSHSKHQYHDVLPASPNSSEVGRVTLEAKNATLLLVRTKLYILYGKETDDTTPSQVFKGKHIIKTAFHGFQGKASDLERMMVSGKREYEVRGPNKLRSTLQHNARVKSKKSGILLVPNDFRTRKMKLNNVGNIGVQNVRRNRR